MFMLHDTIFGTWMASAPMTRLSYILRVWHFVFHQVIIRHGRFSHMNIDVIQQRSGYLGAAVLVLGIG
jgi:hypothetical protein